MSRIDLDDLFTKIADNLPSKGELEQQSQHRYDQSILNPNQFQYWFPMVHQLGIKSPRSVVIPLSKYLSDLAVKEDLSAFRQDLEVMTMVDQIRSLFEHFGSDALFMKNSLFSNKHNWIESCALQRDSDIALHLANNLYQWAMNSPDYATAIIIREMIPTHPVFHAFNRMPITEEYRFFSKDGKTYAYQPYWPVSAIQDPDCEDWESRLFVISNPSDGLINKLADVAASVTKSLGGDWSVDFLIDEKGHPWLIDMAITAQSYHSEDMRSIPKNGENNESKQ